LTQFDAQLAVSLHEHARANPTTVAILTTLTSLGSVKTLTAFAIAVALVMLWRGQHVLSRVWGIVFAGCLLNGVLKSLFQRHRPQFQNPFVIEASWSFPSGHAMGSVIGYGLLAYLLWMAVPRMRSAVVMGTVLLVSAIGFSRLYLGAHYFSDVIAGYAAGLVWLSVSISGIEMLQRTGRLKLFKHRSPVVVPQP
jgi:membrane-associated phospholipid phosphatase